MIDNNLYKIEQGELNSDLIEVGNPVPYVVLVPPDYDPARVKPYPLLLYLHGGCGTAEEILAIKPLLELESTPQAPMAQFVAVCFSCCGNHPDNSAGGQYLDYFDGSQQWDRFAIEALLPLIRQQHHVGDEKTGQVVTVGLSMGGAGALRISFRHPELFTASAALEPHIHGAFSFYELNDHQKAIETPHDGWCQSSKYVGSGNEYTGKLCAIIRQEAYGNPVNDQHWQSWQPASMAAKNPERIKASGLQLYLECGDRDEFEFNFATEFLHRTLLDLGIEHDYHLLRGVNHYGSDTFNRRLYNALVFLSIQVIPTTEESSEIIAVQESINYDARHRKLAAGYQDQSVEEKYRGVCGDFLL